LKSTATVASGSLATWLTVKLFITKLTLGKPQRFLALSTCAETPERFLGGPRSPGRPLRR
jgi:hypothetical protein